MTEHGKVHKTDTVTLLWASQLRCPVDPPSSGSTLSLQTYYYSSTCPSTLLDCLLSLFPHAMLTISVRNAFRCTFILC